MGERQLLRVDVECYAGHRGEQTPRILIRGDRRVVVAEVLDARLAPEYRYFKLRGSDGDTSRPPEINRYAARSAAEKKARLTGH